MRNPNDYQVGGNHYQSERQHWDFVLDCGLGYLEGCATKYVTRWRRAGKPENDLKKALHYTTKLIAEFRTAYPRLRRPQAFLRKELVEFIAANNIPDADLPALVALVTWETERDLRVAYESIEATLNQLEPELADAQPVPLEDSNKHAERDYTEEEILEVEELEHED